MLLTDAQQSRAPCLQGEGGGGGGGGGGAQPFQIIGSGLFRCMGFLHDPDTTLLLLRLELRCLSAADQSPG